MSRQADVGALLLGAKNIGMTNVCDRPDVPRPRLPGREMPKMNLDLGPTVPQGPEIRILPLWLRCVGAHPRYAGRKVPDFLDLVAVPKDPGKRGGQIQPLPWRAFERTKKDIEGVDIGASAFSCRH